MPRALSPLCLLGGFAGWGFAGQDSGTFFAAPRSGGALLVCRGSRSRRGNSDCCAMASCSGVGEGYSETCLTVSLV